MGKEIFDNIPSKVGDLLSNVKNGRIGLPDLQRPFVWKDAKVRELLDSMLKGYPIGYVMLWASPEEYDNVSQIGKNDKVYTRPDELVIDGQQRLTALLAALYGIEIKDKNYSARYIKISFNPLTREFAVWSLGYANNPEWIEKISTVFEADEAHDVSKFRRNYIRKLNEYRQKNDIELLSDEDEDTIEQNIHDLLDLKIYSLPTLKINSKASEEDVADIFVRVNSGGQTLTEKNFIETLLAVYDNDIHDRINKFCSDSRIPANGTSYNQILEVDTSHVIRMAVGVGFKRARLRYAYLLLRGKDLKTGEISEQTRNTNLQIFKNALDVVTDLNNWHSLLNIMAETGYPKGNLVASSNAVVFCYVLYLIGKYDYKVPVMELRKIMRKWIFMSTITYFYTGSTESDVEKQFADLRSVTTAEGFVEYLDNVINSRFTDDYFRLTLPNDLNTSAPISPSWFGYVAAINILGTPLLFSTTPQANYFTVGTSGTKNSIDKHHIFPKNYLEKIGYKSDRDKNQVANFTYLDYGTNIEISDSAPIDYVSRYKVKLGDNCYKLACEQNALPENFETMEYMEFLAERRKLMAKIIQKAYMKLCQ
jgi:hypothetical protein